MVYYSRLYTISGLSLGLVSLWYKIKGPFNKDPAAESEEVGATRSPILRGGFRSLSTGAAV